MSPVCTWIFPYIIDLSDREWWFHVCCICYYNTTSCYVYFPYFFWMFIYPIVHNSFNLFLWILLWPYFSLCCKETLIVCIKYFNTLQIFETLYNLTKHSTPTLAHKPMAGNVLHCTLQAKAPHSVSKAMRWINYYTDEDQNKLCCM